MDYYYKELMKIQRIMSESAEGKQTLQACLGFKKDLDSVKDNIWIVELLTLEAMQKKPTFYKEIFKEAGIQNVELNDDMSFN